MINVRDFAVWLVHLAAEHATDIFNASGNPLPFPEHISITQSVTGHLGSVGAAPEQWLLEQGVNERSPLPFWLVDRDWYGMNARSNKRAINAGLQPRPLKDTLAVILAEEPALEPAQTPAR